MPGAKRGFRVADGSFDDRMAYITAKAQETLGEAPQDITTPGGKSRSSIRLHFKDWSAIATLRQNFRRTHLEAHVLEQLAPYCDDIPRVLGVNDDVLFQSDTGDIRLSEEVMMHEEADQVELAAEACAGIFRIHAAARQTGLAEMMPHLGSNREWIMNLVGSVDALQAYSMGISKEFDFVAVAERMDPGSPFLGMRWGDMSKV